MKKILAILSITAVIAACNNSGETEKAAEQDSVTAAESPLMDAVNTADSASKIIHDSSGKIIDTSKHK